MLAVPETGFNQSVHKNNVDRIVLGDWVEATTLFVADVVSINDIVDVLTEQQICSDQDLAHEIAAEGWQEVSERSIQIGPASCIRVGQDRFERAADWDRDIARSFLVALSLARLYPPWAAAHEDAIVQGTLFERLVYAAVRYIFDGWEIYHSGWSPAGLRQIPDVVGELCGLLGTTGDPDEVSIWVGQAAKDAGLDLVCYRAFHDGREALPAYFMQCASGRNWVKKLSEPDPNLWRNLLNAAFNPKRALAIPFVLDRDELRRKSVVVDGPLFDRTRLLSVSRIVQDWVPQDLKDELRQWLEPRIATLPHL